jgi:ElaA protein
MMHISWTCPPFGELTSQQLYDIMVLRQAVFVVEQNCPYLDADGLDQVGWHLCGYDEEGDLVAYARILPQGTSYSHYPAIGRVVTSSKIRGKGHGRELMRTCIRHTKALLGKSPIKISAQNHLRDYYRSLGFQPVGEVYDEDGIPHIAMLLH